ncbi:MAG: protease complex subunit PrcB family protein [Firmicutes bacterium]|nr:protease complex subunit PrcB family protein [Bacillota bacterium]
MNKQINMPAPIITWAERVKDTAGIYYTPYEGQTVYAITAGEKPSGGYQVVITKQTPSFIYYRIAGPAPADYVIQIITYPYQLLFSETPLRFICIDKGTEELIEPRYVPLTL